MVVVWRINMRDDAGACGCGEASVEVEAEVRWRGVVSVKAAKCGRAAAAAAATAAAASELVEPFCQIGVAAAAVTRWGWMRCRDVTTLTHWASNSRCTGWVAGRRSRCQNVSPTSELVHTLSKTFPANRRHPSCDDCLEDSYQNCFVLYYVPHLCSVICTQLWTIGPVGFALCSGVLCRTECYPPAAVCYLGLSVRETECVCVSVIILLTRYLINQLCEFHQIYCFGAVGDKDELIRFSNKRSKVKGYSHSKTIYGHISTLVVIFSVG